jgi:hypothetical protein
MAIVATLYASVKWAPHDNSMPYGAKTAGNGNRSENFSVLVVDLITGLTVPRDLGNIQPELADHHCKALWK